MADLWREELIPINRWTRPGIRREKTTKTVWHYTANPGATADNHVKYFGETVPRLNEQYIQQYGEAETRRRGLIVEASANIFIDRYGAKLMIPLDEESYHASQANSYTVGVELCIEKDGTFHPDTIAWAVKVGAYLNQLYGLDPLFDNIRHYDVTGKRCPAPFVDDPTAWEAFKQAIANNEGEDETNMPMKLEDWQWNMLYEVMGKAYNVNQLNWDWMQKILDRTLTASELAFLNTVLDGRIDRKIEI